MNYKELCPVGTNVRIIAPIGSDHDFWTVMPVVRDKSKMFIPEGYELIEGVGEVTHHEHWENMENVTDLIKYDNLVIVQQYIQCTLNIDWWLKEQACEN
jgi:hypothetical protein